MAQFQPKLTLEQREEVKSRLAAGEIPERIAFDLKIGATTVRRILNEGKEKNDGSFDFSKITCEEKEQGYRENLRWAINAAGTYLRTKRHPESCPCNAALYLYRQAISEPKDFITKVGQLENKREDNKKESLRRSVKRAVAEIDSMLIELESADERTE